MSNKRFSTGDTAAWQSHWDEMSANNTTPELVCIILTEFTYG